jgi:nitrate reductase alpha subunit
VPRLPATASIHREYQGTLVMLSLSPEWADHHYVQTGRCEDRVHDNDWIEVGIRGVVVARVMVAHRIARAPG